MKRERGYYVAICLIIGVAPLLIIMRASLESHVCSKDREKHIKNIIYHFTERHPISVVERNHVRILHEVDDDILDLGGATVLRTGRYKRSCVLGIIRLGDLTVGFRNEKVYHPMHAPHNSTAHFWPRHRDQRRKQQLHTKAWDGAHK